MYKRVRGQHESRGDLAMGAMTLELEHNRQLLSHAIVDVLASWSELHRRVFIMAHYQGRSLERISSCLGLSVADVRRILDDCDRDLRASLRTFRECQPGSMDGAGTGGAVLSFSGCFS